MPPRRKRRSSPGWWTRRPKWMPPSDHPVWPGLRLLVLVGFMYYNASNFDWTEGRTILAVTVMEFLGLRGKKA